MAGAGKELLIYTALDQLLSGVVYGLKKRLGKKPLTIEG